MSLGEAPICSWIWPGSSRLYIRRRNSAQVPEIAGVGRYFSPVSTKTTPVLPQDNRQPWKYRHFIAQTSGVQHVVLHMSNNHLHPRVSISIRHKSIFSTPPSFPYFPFPIRHLPEIIKPLNEMLAFFFLSTDLIFLTIVNISRSLYMISLSFLMPSAPSKLLSILIFINVSFTFLKKVILKYIKSNQLPPQSNIYILSLSLFQCVLLNPWTAFIHPTISLSKNAFK